MGWFGSFWEGFLEGFFGTSSSRSSSSTNRKQQDNNAIKEYYETYINNMYLRAAYQINDMFDSRVMDRYSEFYDPNYPRIFETIDEDESIVDDTWLLCPDGACDLDKIYLDCYGSYSRDLCYNDYHAFFYRIPTSVLRVCSSYVVQRVHNIQYDYDKILEYFNGHKNEL